MEFSLPMMIEDALQSIQTEMKAEELSLSGEQVQTLFAPIQFEQQSVSASAKSEEELSQARGLVYVLMFLIYFAVIVLFKHDCNRSRDRKIITCHGNTYFKCFTC